MSSVYYASPVVTFDSATGAIIEEWRDSKTGAELYQSPTQAALLYAHTQALGRGEGASSKGSAASLSTAAQASLLPVPPAASVPVSSSAGSRAIYG
ncbi:MAG TPA: hypothetical protein HPP80_01790 [Rhodospirillaceae bacterium]|nr:hypothetical protein [Rhodospirillaceae bacterium]